MPLSNLLFWICIILIIASFFLFPSFWKKLIVLFGGFLNVFVEDKAKTPDGANAIYSKAIEAAEDGYNKTHSTLSKFTGQLDSAKRKLDSSKEKLKSVEKQCESLVKNGKIEQAEVLVEERETLLSEIKQQTMLVERLVPLQKEAEELFRLSEKKLRQLKQERKEVVSELSLNSQMSQAYDDLDELKKSKAIDKLLDSVNDAQKESREKVVGAKTIHENKLSTRIARAEEAANKSSSNEYLEKLKAKYNK